MREPPTAAETSHPAASAGARHLRAPLGALMAGGASRRMGRPKAGLEVGGVGLATRAVRTLTACGAGRVVQVGGEPLGTPDLPCWPDRRPDQGPAAGLETALERHGGPVIACAVDLPMVPPGLLRVALRRVRAGAVAAVPRHGGRWQPLAAAYAPDALPDLRRWLDGGGRSLQGWLDRIGAWPLEAPTLRAWGPPERVLLNVNTPDALERARSMLDLR